MARLSLEEMMNLREFLNEGGHADPLQVALHYALNGWPVLPIHSTEPRGQQIGCACGNHKCKCVGKHPIGRLVANGLKNATTDSETIKSWWERRPNANIGVATGAESGIVVMDIDPQYYGNESLKQLIDEYGPLPDTWQQKTGGSGLHIFFKHPGTHTPNQVSWRLGIDIRGDGAARAYVVSYPSHHKSGGHYTWDLPLPEEIAEMPVWLNDELTLRSSAFWVVNADMDNVVGTIDRASAARHLHKNSH